MTDPTPAPSLPSLAGPTEGGGPGRWFALRPFVALALLVVAAGMPLDATWQWGVVALAVAGILACAWPILRAPWGTPGSAVLVVGAVLGVLGPFAYANPWFGVDASEWVWDYWASSRRWVDRVDLLLWAVVAVLALAAAATRGRVIAALGLAAVVLLAARGFAEQGALSLVRMERVNLVWTLAAGALGGAMVHLASASARGRGAARALALVAVAVIATVYATWFPEQGEGAKSSLRFYAEELPPIFGAAFRGAESDPAFRAAMTQQTWYVGVPFLLQAVALLLAVVVAAFPSRVRARPVRWVAAVALLAFVGTWLVPTRATIWFSRDVAAGLRETRYAQAVGETLMKAGLAVFLLLAGAVAAILGRGPAPAAPGLASRLPAPRLRWIYGAAAATGLFVLWAAVHPEHGLEVVGTIGEVLGRGQWDVSLARVAYRGLLVVAGVAALLLPGGRARGTLAVAVAAMALTALAPPQARWLGGVDTYVAPAAAVVAAAAAAFAASRGARLGAVVGALLTLALLLYPQAVTTTFRPDGAVSIPLRSALLDDTIGELLAAEDVGVVLWVPGRLATLGFALTAVLALLAAAFRSPKLGAGAVGAFLGLTILAPVVSQVLGGGGGGPPGSATMAVARSADVLLEWSIPTILLLLAGALDLFGGAANTGIASPPASRSPGDTIGAGVSGAPIPGTSSGP